MQLLDTLYSINKHTGLDGTIWDRLYIKRVLGHIVRAVTNWMLPFFLGKSTKTLSEGIQVPIIVSITSFPARIERLWMTVESIICQSHKPQLLLLWLSREQFPHELLDIPQKLLDQRNRGLTIRFVDGDIKSYKKFLYAFREYSNALVLTLDDDLLLPSYFIKSIYECKLQHPNDVIGSFGFRFSWNDDINYIHPTGIQIKPGDSGNDLFFGSGGGTLLDTKLSSFMDSIDIIIELCPTADDIYLNALVRRSGYGITFHMNNPLLSVISRGKFSLVNHNGDIGDPSSINASQMKHLIDYYKSKSIPNPFRV